MNPLTVVMYHYVRNLRRSRYPEIRALESDAFERQLGFFISNYAMVSMDDVVSALNGEGTLPEKAALLTFDDGYMDHYETVFPMLFDRKLQGVFFPPTAAVIGNEVLDVNKIHFILSSCTDPSILVDEIDRTIETERDKYDLPSLARYKKQFFQKSRYDPPEIIYIKRMLQLGLPMELRREIAARLFARFVTEDEAAFSRELYMNVDQLRAMTEGGQHIGSHGDEHEWLSKMSREAQERNIRMSLEMQTMIHGRADPFTFCYPYGDYNEETLEILQELGCVAAFTTEPTVATISSSKRLTLARLDTNDFPQ